MAKEKKTVRTCRAVVRFIVAPSILIVRDDSHRHCFEILTSARPQTPKTTVCGAKMDLLAGVLEGTYRGEGKGYYPTIQPFTYTEEVVFARLGDKPVFSYSQRTRNAEGVGLHAESGFLRVFPDHAVEFIIASPTGLAEVEHGKVYVDDTGVVRIDVESGQETKEGGRGIMRADRNKEPKTLMVVRRFHLDRVSGVLRYTLLMSTSTTPKLTPHLECTMKKN